MGREVVHMGHFAPSDRHRSHAVSLHMLAIVRLNKDRVSLEIARPYFVSNIYLVHPLQQGTVLHVVYVTLFYKP